MAEADGAYTHGRYEKKAIKLLCNIQYIRSTMQDRHNKKKFEGSQPEWCISSMIYSKDTPFWSETLEYHVVCATGQLEEDIIITTQISM